MVDFIKITNARVNPEVFLDSPHLSFTGRVDTGTGELIGGGRSAMYRGMKFSINAGGVTGLSGSLHKYYNDGIQNYDDFTLMKLSHTIEDLQSRFQIDPSLVELNNIEFGVNIEVPFSPDDFINHLVIHNYKQFNIEKSAGKNFAFVAHSQFILKIYNKGLQFGQDKNILRFEVKIIRMEKVKSFGVRTLNDLLIPDKLIAIRTMLLKIYNEIVYYEDIVNLKSLPQQERDLLRDGYNPNFWQEHHKKSGSNSSKKLRKYQMLILKYGKSNFQSIEQSIGNKWDELLQDTCTPVRDITAIDEVTEPDQVRDITIKDEVTKSDEVRDITNSDERVFTEVPEESPAKTFQIESTSINTLSIGEEVVLPNSNRQCIVTGLDISMQKGTSRFLSITGIRYYMINDPEIFNKLLTRLTEKWKDESLDKKIFELAHSIRNSFHSSRIHTKKAIVRLCLTPSLFNNYDLVSQQKKNIANQ